MTITNPLSAPHEYYWDAVTSPLPTEGKVTEIIKKIVLVTAGIFLIPLFGIMKLIGDKMPVNTAVIFINISEPFEVKVGNDIKFSAKKHGDKLIEDY